MTIQRAPGSGRGVARGLAVMIGVPPELAEPAGERAVAAMMALKQARDAGGGAVRGQHLHHAQQHIAALDPARHGTLVQHLNARVLALQGRGGDTRIAHVTPGEVVVPNRVQTPGFMKALHALARAHGIDPAQLRVASGRNRINPNTGEMEFDFYDPLENLDFGSFQFGEFEPGAFDPGNFNVNDLSGYTTPSTDFSYSGGAPDIGNLTGSFDQSVGPLATSIGPSGAGLLSTAPINGNLINAGTPSYTDADGNPVEGVTVSASRSNPNLTYFQDPTGAITPHLSVTALPLAPGLGGKSLNDLNQLQKSVNHDLSNIRLERGAIHLGQGLNLAAPFIFPAESIPDEMGLSVLDAGLDAADKPLHAQQEDLESYLAALNQRLNILKGATNPPR